MKNEGTVIERPQPQFLTPQLVKPTKAQFLIALGEIEKFSPAPVILANAMRLIRDPQSDIASIAGLIGSDSALAADIIRCSNSVFYGGSSSMSIGEAVQRLGMRETLRLLNLAVGRIVSGRDLDCYGIHGTDYWAESLFNGLFMEALARECGETEPDEAYTVGLLRFIGRLAINQAVENIHGGLFWDGNESISQWEIDNVGVVQAQAGAILLEKWRFPDPMVQAIAGQDAPATLPEHNWLADALFFTAAILPQGLGKPFSPDVGPIWPATPLGSDFMHQQGLTTDAVEALLQSTSERFEKIREDLGT